LPLLKKERNHVPAELKKPRSWVHPHRVDKGRNSADKELMRELEWYYARNPHDEFYIVHGGDKGYEKFLDSSNVDAEIIIYKVPYYAVVLVGSLAYLFII
jgi:hypothetical protein